MKGGAGMTALEEYRACMERLQRVREALAALLDKPRQIDRLDDEAMPLAQPV